MCDYDFGSVDFLKTVKRASKAVQRGDRPADSLMRDILNWLDSSEAKERTAEAERQKKLDAAVSVTYGVISHDPLAEMRDEIHRLNARIDAFGLGYPPR